MPQTTVARLASTTMSATAVALLTRMLDDAEKGAKFEAPDAHDVLLHVNDATFPAAFTPDGRTVLETLMADAAALERAGAIRVVRRRVRGGGERVELRMGPRELPHAYALATPHGYTPLRMALDAMQREVERLRATAARDAAVPMWWPIFLDRIADGLRTANLRPLGIASRARLKTEWQEVRDALVAADRLSRTVDAWARHVSEALFGNSKRLTAIQARVASVLREADPRWSERETDGPPDPAAVLEAYGIRRRPVTITCAGAVPIQLDPTGGRVYALDDFVPVATLPSAWGAALADGALAGPVEIVTTIENEYPFLSYVEEMGGPAGLGARRELVIYTGGFPSEPVLAVLEALGARSAGRIAFRHWGDADPDGLSIWWQLRCRIRRPVALYRTTAEWVDAATGREGTPLTPRDERLLAAHLGRCRDAAAADGAADDCAQAIALAGLLLRRGVKLEQERQ